MTEFKYSRYYQGRIERWDEEFVQYPDDARLEKWANEVCPVCRRLAWQHSVQCKRPKETVS